MVSQNPRDMRDWMRTVERHGAQLRGIPSIVHTATETVRDEAVRDRTRQPAAPVELSWQTGLYLDTSGRGRVRLVADFPDVTKATDGTGITAASYELWGYDDTVPLLTGTTSALPGIMAAGSSFPGALIEGLASGPERAPRLLATSATSAFRADGFLPGTVWKFAVRALGLGMVTPGKFSEQATVAMHADTVAPPQTTAPVLTVARGTIIAEWDGQAVTGTMPADFKYAILAHGTSSSPTVEVARFGRDGGRYVLTGIDYYDPQFFRLAAVDESGNIGPWSEQAVGYTTPLVDADIILSTIDAAKTHLKNIDAGVSILPNTIVTEHLVVTEEMSAAIGNFLTVNVDMLNANSIWADEIWVGLADAVLVRADMFEGKEFVGGKFTGPLIQTDAADLTGLKFDSAGLRAWNQSGTNTFTLDALTGNVSAVGTFKSGTQIINASLDGSVFANMPGLQFNTGMDRQLQPAVVGFAPGNTSTFRDGTLLMYSSEAVINSSGRSQLQLTGDGYAFALATVFGPNSGRGIILEDGVLRLAGPLLWGGYNISTYTSTVTAPTAVGSGTWNITYASPAPSGTRRVQVTADAVAPVSFVTQANTNSGFKIVWTGPDNNNLTFYCMTTWFA